MRLLACIVVVASLGGVANAFPRMDGTKSGAVAEAVHPVDSGYSFDGAARLDGCSGALIRLHGQSMDDDALVLTNGHCVGFPDPGVVWVNKPTQRGVRFYNADETLIGSHTASLIVYATMTRTDMAILRLEGVSYNHLKDEHDVDALFLSSEPGVVGEEIVVVSGFWEYTTECTYEALIPTLIEGAWTSNDSLRYSEECETFGGTSGSPVISINSGEVIGVNNTGYEGGTPCTDNNPCEVDADGTVTTLPDRGYGQQTFWLYSCLNGDLVLDLSLEGCALPAPG